MRRDKGGKEARGTRDTPHAVHDASRRVTHTERETLVRRRGATRSLPLPAPCDRAQSACPPAPRAGGCDAVRSQDWRISTILAMPARTLAA